ncbi:PAS domain S-box protein [Saccharicrinis sp. FJH54]|uniref:PAS domain S-box protein n=1 Tax=Saccharicrinis sp. FJH54 TaxID=3344665 RepID=UPI0035D44E50
MEITLDLIKNSALLVSLTVFYSVFAGLRAQKPLLYKVATGLCFGAVAVAGMSVPFELKEGIFIDGRTIVIALAGLFGGWLPAAVSVVITSLYRFMVGGAGMYSGMASIVISGVVGLVFRWISHNRPERTKNVYLFLFGGLVHMLTLPTIFMTPGYDCLAIFKVIWLPVMLILPTALVAMSMVLKAIEKQLINERLLKEAENLYRSTFYSTLEALITTSLEGKIVRMNKAAEEITGWKEKNAIGRHPDEIFKLVSNKTMLDIRKATEDVLLNGVSFEIDLDVRLENRMGEKPHVTGSFSALTDNKGSIVGMVVAFRDQTELWNHQKRLLEDEERFRTMFESHGAVKLIIDTETGILIDANKAAGICYGLKLEDLIGMNISVISSDEWSDIKKMLKSNISKGVFHTECQHRHRDGHLFDVEMFFSEITIHHKKLYHIIVNDITEKNLLLRELIIAKEKAEESERLKCAFLENMNHEIRTPLNGILGFSEMLTEEDLPVDIKREYLSIINKSSDELLALINDILDISKLHTNLATLNNDSFNVAETLNSIYSAYSEKLRDNNDLLLELDLQVSDINFSGDEQRLVQIFNNLLDNALKFTESGNISFGIKYTDEKNICMFVSDTGIGIEDSKHEHIFDSFYQAHDNAEKLYGGTGIGLAIVKKLVDMMQGEIILESEKGKGASFYIYLPLRREKKPVLSIPKLNFNSGVSVFSDRKGMRTA